MKNKLLIGLVGIGALVAALSPFIANATPLYFAPTPPAAQTAVATSTLVYMTAGTATSTITWDSYAAGDQYKTDQAALLIQATGSSTNTVYNVAFEYSQDGVDWYQDDWQNYSMSTTTGANNVSMLNTYFFNYATSTLDGVATTTVPENRILNVNTPVRFVRAVLSLKPGSTAGAIWAKFVPAKQTPN